MNLKEVIQQEQQLVFSQFTSDLALAIVDRINTHVQNNYPKPVGVLVSYDRKVIIHYLMEGRKESPWLFRKKHTVECSGHSSLFVYYHQSDEAYVDWQEQNEHAICGGGFPITVNGEVRGAICISGLDHLDDHKIITDVLYEIINNL